MADNVAFTPGSGATGATDDIGGVHYPRVKLALGADGVAVDAVAGAGVVGTGVQRMTLASDDPVVKVTTGHYETVAASQTNQAMGATGATGDYLAGVLVVPATISPGNIQIKDGAGSAVTIFTGGTSSVSNLVPFFITLGVYSTSGAWQITTGANVSAIGVGRFTA